MQFKTISVVGLGYIGLPTAAVFASHGVKVLGLDVNKDVVTTINQGKIHIIEPDLKEAVKKAVEKRMLRAMTAVNFTNQEAKEPRIDAFLIAVPTPFKNSSYTPDLSFIESAAQTIAPALQTGSLVILESTSPVGTTEQLAKWLAKARSDLSFPQTHGEASDIRIAYCPERVLPGQVLQELISNDRVIGGLTPKCSQAACDLYNIFLKGECVITTARTAEMCKLAENSFRDVNIAFANELSMICDQLDIDIRELIQLANRHPRVNILQPGPGVGGHCIAIDPWFIVSKTPEQARIIRTAREVNDEKIQWVLDKIDQAVQQIVAKGIAIETVNIACLGLAYKANVGDLRESPALSIVQSLVQKYPGRIAVVEPHLQSLPDNLQEGGAVAMRETQAAVDWADIIVALVGHSQFKSICFAHVHDKIFVDVAGIKEK